MNPVLGPVLGAVLVGGASSRFGSDKAAARWAGATLVDHAAGAIAPFCATVVLVGGLDVPDLPRVGLGPLGGIAAAMDHGARGGFVAVLTIACDMPRVPGGLVEALLRRAPSYCADAPVLGHWPAAAAGDLIDRLDALAFPHEPDAGRGARQPRSGALSVRGWAEAIGALPVAAPGPLANVNTVADLMAL